MQRIYLIGYRATGKTTVARQLALRAGWDWVDCDVEIELRAGKSIAEIFADDGESRFRDLETETIESLACREKTVIALGGGAVLREANRQFMTGGPIIWLQASADTIHDRLAADPTTLSRRPNLTNWGGRQEIEQLLGQRNPIYRQCATLVVDTESRTPDQVVEAILGGIEL